MVENSAQSAKPPRPAILGAARHTITFLRENPVVIKELRGQMRGNRGFIMLTVYLLIITFIISIVYMAFYRSNSQQAMYNPSIEARQEFGKILFYLVLGLETFGVLVISPSMTAGSITSEREHQTIDLVRTTLLSPRELVYGKFFSGFSFILLMLLASLPLQSLAFLFGGVAPGELLINMLVLIITAAGFCAVGTLASSLFKSSKVANGAAYGISFFWVLLLPGLLVFWFTVFDSRGMSGSNTTQSFIIQAILWHMISLNPISTIIVTEMLAIDNQTFLLYNTNFNGTPIMLLSPWVYYSILSLFITILMLAFSARVVRRMET
jgi:ABC-2 type transport system permease protein